ncbi:MAG: hypothetical protein WDM96_10175 [Lacunisphaera sp.]
MDVHVHQARQQGRRLQVDHGVAGSGRREAVGDRFDAVAGHGDCNVLARRVRAAVDQAAGVDKDFGKGRTDNGHREPQRQARKNNFMRAG